MPADLCQAGGMTDTETMCEYCGDNPTEPRLPCCANNICMGEYQRDLDEDR